MIECFEKTRQILTDSRSLSEVTRHELLVKLSEEISESFIED